MIFRYIFMIFLSVLLTACKQWKKEKSLNVVLLVIDDMGYGDIAAHGNPIIKTPNFDRMHDQSARFTNFSVSPTCAPTRAALLTGKHEFLSGVTHTIVPMRNMDPESITIADLFQKEGYKTGLFGKWHLGQTEQYGPWDRGFEETLTVPGDLQNSHFNPVLLKNRVEIKYEGYREDILFNEAMNFITDNKDQAFFCYLATYSPHSPHIVPEEYTEPYKNYLDTVNSDNFIYIAEFNGQIANVDENLGRLQTHLKALDLEDNTLLIVIGDNGGTFGVDTYNAGMRGVKGTTWHGGTRVFSFWQWGKRLFPGERDQMAGHIDILPTLADLCNLDIPPELQQQLEGNSLGQVLEIANATLNEDRMHISHLGRWAIPESWADHKYASCAVRWKHYTLVRNEPCRDENCLTCFNALVRGMNQPSAFYTRNNEHYALTTPGKWELFDIESDPYQENNIAEKNPEIVNRMSDHYDKWWAKVEKKMTERWGK